MNYIEKVLSHIKSDKNKKEIEYELFDHIDEHKKFFEEIGYDEETAILKAEEKMGDADVLGEQFKARKKLRILPVMLIYLFMFLIVFIDVAFVLRNDFNLMLSVDRYGPIMIPVFWGITFALIGVAYGLFMMFYGFKNKGIFISITGYIMSIAMLFLAPVEWMHIFSKDYFCEFYTSQYYPILFGSYQLSIEQLVVAVTLFLIITIAFLFGVISVIKSKRFCNSKKDLVLCKIAKTSTIVLIVLISLYIVGLVIGINYVEDEVYETAQIELEQANQFVIDNYNDFEKTNIDDISNKIMTALPNFISVDENYFSSPSGAVAICVYCNENKAEIQTYDCILSPFEFSLSPYVPADLYSSYYDSERVNEFDYVLFKDDRQVLNYGDFVVAKDTTIYDVPLCAAVSYYTDTISFDYNDGKYITFGYDNEQKGYVLSEYSDMEFDKSSLTKKQTQLLESALWQCLQPNNYRYSTKKINLIPSNNDYSLGSICDSYADILDVQSNEELGLYKVTLVDYCYKYNFFSGRNDFISYDTSNKIYDYIVRFEDGEAQVLSYVDTYEPSRFDNKRLYYDNDKSEIDKRIIQNIKEKYNLK